MGESWNLSPPDAPTYRDRSTGLLLFGLLEILLALGALGIAALSALVLMSPAVRAAQMQSSPRASFGALLMYPLAAVFFGTLGVGTLLGRRWARAIMLIVSWLWLAVGVLASLAMIFILPKIMKAAFAAGPASQVEGAQAASTCGMVAAGVMVAFFYVALPLAFVLFYRSPHVRATCEWKDPRVRWTDRCPLPVLGAALCAAYFACGGLFGWTYGVFPIGGTLLTGLSAALAYLAMGAVNALLAVGLYRLRPAAWWGAVFFGGLLGISTLVTFQRGFPWRQMYDAMGTPKEQIELIERSGMLEAFHGPGIMIPLIVGLVATFAYLAWIRKYFYGYRDPASGPTETAVSVFS